MSKKIQIRAQKMKNESDPSLARRHENGSKAELVQPAHDKKWGRYYFNHYTRYFIILSKSLEEYDKAIELLSECRKVKVDQVRGVRSINSNLRNELEYHSMQFLILFKLGFEYMTQEMLPVVNNILIAKEGLEKFNWDNIDLNIRVNSLLKSLSITVKIPSDLFNLFIRRDIVEHPTSDRLYNATENGWKNNHLAWVLSGDLCINKKEIIDFINIIIKTFDEYYKNNPVPGKLEGVTRGLKSGDSFKNKYE